MTELREKAPPPERPLGTGATRRWIVLLVAAAVAGPIIALGAQGAGYMSAGPACFEKGLGANGLHLIPLAGVVLAAIAIWIALTTRRRAGNDWAPDSAAPAARDSMLATLGIVLGSFGTLLVLGYWFVILMLHPCWGS